MVMLRYSSINFPAYAHLPGQTPHPTRDPKGHSYNQELTLARFEPEAWDQSTQEQYRYGIDLHNHGFFWECHETLEGVWKTRQRDEPTAKFLQGIIQLSVAHSYILRGKAHVSPKLAGWALEKWLELPYKSGQPYAGIELTSLITIVQTWQNDPTATRVIIGLGDSPSRLKTTAGLS